MESFHRGDKRIQKVAIAACTPSRYQLLLSPDTSGTPWAQEDKEAKEDHESPSYGLSVKFVASITKPP